MDYDDLGKKAEAATNIHFVDWTSWYGKGPWPHPVPDNSRAFIAAMSPKLALRLLGIIEIAKQSLVDIALRAGRSPEAISIIQIARDGLKQVSELEIDD